MKNFLLIITLLISPLVGAEKKPLTVGIILPMEHQALNDIAQGFQDQFSAQYGAPVTYKVQNAQGDLNLQQAIIKNLIDQDVDLLVPIATHTAQMTLKLSKKIPVVTLAAIVPEAERLRNSPVNATGVLDEVPPLHALSFLKHLRPHLKHMTLIHSASDKIIKEVEEAKEEAKKMGITVQALMIQTLPDLYTMAKSIEDQSEVLYILKDNLVASGIATLKNIAKKKGILLLTSDEGTVKEGAPLGIGVTEYDIGKEGAKRAIDVFSGHAIADLPILQMSNLKVFVDEQSVQKFGLDLPTIQNAATTAGLIVVAVEGRRA